MGDNSKQVNFIEASDFVPKPTSHILNKASSISDFSNKSSEIDLFVRSLEDEMRKVDAFKRELPLCMQLLQDGIEKLKEEKLQCEERETKPVMEEFMMSKSNSNGDGRAKMSNDFSEKRNWMSSVRLWSTFENKFDTLNQESFLSLKSGYGEEEANIEFLKNRGRGAFSSFNKPSGVTISDCDQVCVQVLEIEPIHARVRGSRGVARPRLQELHQQQPQRKQRRCWSPELHGLFVDAIDNLGGAEVATSKQIREHMKVEGLTNDEVKSHLQKYRIHVRRLASASAGPAGLPWLRQPQMAAKFGSS